MNYKVTYNDDSGETVILDNVPLTKALLHIRVHVIQKNKRFLSHHHKNIPPAIVERAQWWVDNAATMPLPVDLDTGIVYLNNEEPDLDFYRFIQI